MEQRYDSRLQERKAAGLFRELPTSQPTGLDFTNNDYLGLSRNQTVVQAAQEAAHKYGLGGQASRLLGAVAEPTRQLESLIATGKSDKGRCLIFPTGFQLNSTAVSTLLNEQLLGVSPLVFADRLIHASMHAGIQLSGARQHRFKHNDLDHLESLLKKRSDSTRPKIVFVESIYGMDGDRAPLAELYRLKAKYGFFLYVDEAHALGVTGESGYGLARQSEDEADVVIGTFSKAIGASGGYLVASETVCDLLVNFAPGFIYSTAPSPVVMAGVAAAWKLIATMGEARAHLDEIADWFRRSVGAMGLDTGASDSHIVPVVLGEPEHALQRQRELSSRQIEVACIRPPTVPAGMSRLRLSFSALHTRDHVVQLVEALSRT